MTDPTPEVAQVNGMADFSAEVAEEKKFSMDGDVFYLAPDLAAGLLMEFTAKYNTLTELPFSEQQPAFEEMFRLVMRKDSADLFMERMVSADKPIGLKQLNKVMPWMLEQYGLRPTEPSENSSDGQPNPESGTSSTVVVSSVDSTSTPSVSTGS